jgi:molybdopterin/thiamine biosynthesis adenylyltransferase
MPLTKMSGLVVGETINSFPTGTSHQSMPSRLFVSEPLVGSAERGVMDISISSGLFSRETLAGYDRECMSSAVATVVGLGAGGCNAVQTLGLAGVHELRLIDFDTVEPSNLTRSPLFDRRRLAGKRTRYKAREAALGALACSYAADPVVRSAIARFEEVGLGALVGSDVVVATVDSLRIRALLADATRMLGIPMVELGFSESRGQISVFPNTAGDEPCWRCLHPEVVDGVASCTLYAQGVVESGAIPATQPLAAVLGALAAEHGIQAVHGRFPLGGRAMFLDLHTGQSRVLHLTTDPDCPGVHRRLAGVRPLAVRSEEPVRAVLEAVREFTTEPVIHLPAPYVVEMPCAACGSPIEIGKPVWGVTQPPRCAKCPDLPRLGDSGIVVASTVAGDDPLAQRRCRTLGLPPAAIFEVEDRATGAMHVVSLAGGLDDLFETRRRDRNAPASLGINKDEEHREEKPT